MDPKTTIREYWRSFAEGDLDATWKEFVSPDMVIHPSSGYAFTRQTWLEAEKQLMAAFADVRVEVLDQIAEGNRVATRFRFTGTQTAEFFGVPSSGRTATLTGTTFDVVENGRTVEHWAEIGVPGFLAQLAGSES